MAKQERTTKQVVEDTRSHLSELVDAHKALAKAEVADEVKAQVAAIVPLAAAGVIGLYILGFLLVTAAKGIEAAGLAEWIAWLIVSGVLILLAVIAVLVGRSKAKANARRDAPAARIKGEVQTTVDWAKANVKQEDGR